MRHMFSAMATACLLALGGNAFAQEAEASPTFDKIKSSGKVVLGVIGQVPEQGFQLRIRCAHPAEQGLVQLIEQIHQPPVLLIHRG